jgi:hypothetical protein
MQCLYLVLVHTITCPLRQMDVAVAEEDFKLAARLRDDSKVSGSEDC